MTSVRLPTSEITNFESFHRVCAQVFGFPDFYGMNMNAWVDCMIYMDEDVRMTRFRLGPGERLEIEVLDTAQFIARVPDVFSALVESAAWANRIYVEDGKSPALALIFL